MHYFKNTPQNDNKNVPLSEKLSLVIEKAMSATTRKIPISSAATAKSKELSKIIKGEMALFENGGCRGSNLQLCYEYLLTIPPTSVQSERAFSVAGSFATKLRSKLGDTSLNALVALKSYFNYLKK